MGAPAGIAYPARVALTATPPLIDRLMIAPATTPLSPTTPTRLRADTPKVYLAGPISGLSYDGATDWREGVAAALAPDIAGYSPLRGKHYLQHETSIGDSYEQSLLSSQAAITARDRNDCRTCDLIVFNFLGATKASIGSCIELGWGDAFGKPMILVMEPEGNVHDHAMVRQVCGWRTRSLDEAVAVIRAVLLP